MMMTEAMQDALMLHYKAATIETDLVGGEFSLSIADEIAQENPVLSRVLLDLRTAQDEFGDSHNDVAEAWNALGLIRIHMQRNPEGARECHVHALRIFKKNSQDAETAITLNDLGYCHEQIGESQQALGLYQEALCMLIKLKLPKTHPCLLATQRAVSRIRRE